MKHTALKITTLLLVAAFCFGSVGLIKSKSARADADLFKIARDETVSKDDIDNAKKARDDARRRARNASKKVKALSSQESELSAELKKLTQLSDEQKAQYEIISGQLSAALDAKALALDAYILAEENLTTQQKLFEERVSVMFEHQNKSTLEILLESDSVAGFFTNMEMISFIADADKQAIDAMQIALDDAILQRDIALKEADDMQRIADEKQAQLDELESRIGVTSEALENVSTELSDWEKQEADLDQLAQDMNDLVRKLQNKYDQEHPATTTTTTTTTAATTKATTSSSDTTTTTAASSKQSDDTTTTTSTTTTKATTAAPTDTPTPTPKPKKNTSVSLAWPVSCRTITSYYGYRTHPVYGNVRFHSGIDISGDGATYGSTISAAAAGTVIYVSTPVQGKNTGGSGYGNYCMISHGNGIVTLYGHARRINVSEGQTVKKGQKIGEVGSTGTSTGAHLHFEVRVNGSTVDPLNYLP